MTNLKKKPDFDQYEINNVFFVQYFYDLYFSLAKDET